MAITTLFFDLDGVLVDPVALHAVYQDRTVEVMTEALGGAPADWARANEEVYERILVDPYPWADDPLTRYRQEQVRTVRMLCAVLGRPAPPSDEACQALAARVEERVRADPAILAPGAGTVLAGLDGRFTLHAASGNASWLVAPVLRNLGVADRFGLACGCDLVGTWKGAPGFYERLFALAGVAPQEALVVDDRARQIGAATEAGAAGVLVGREASRAEPGTAAIAHVTELPAALAALAGGGGGRRGARPRG